MKQVFTLVAMVLSFSAFAQKEQAQIVFFKGQKYFVTDSISRQIDMGMGMGVKTSGTLENKFVILDISGKEYVATKTLTAVKMSMDIMGQQVSYDSDKKEDSASEIGKSLSHLNKPDTFMIDKFTGAVRYTRKDTTTAASDGNPFASLFESMSNMNDTRYVEQLTVIPPGKKMKDSWTDSSSTRETKTSTKYVLLSLDKNTATLMMDGNMQTTISTEAQGMQVSVSMATKTTGEIIVNTKNSLVSRKETKSDISGTMDMMGQSMPITGTATSLSVYTY